MWRAFSFAVAMLFVLLLAACGSAPSAELEVLGGRPLSTALTGAAEVPGPGDPDGIGTASLTLNPGLGEICFDIVVADIAPATAAHIHVGTAEVAGPVVVNFGVATNGLSGCVNGVEQDLIKAIIQTPNLYYVNVHNARPIG
jgi:hypothetical protein